MNDEPTIIINGHVLGEGQAIALRVAANSFLLELSDPDALGADTHGRLMVEAYRARLREIITFMHTDPAT